MRKAYGESARGMQNRAVRSFLAKPVAVSSKHVHYMIIGRTTKSTLGYQVITTSSTMSRRVKANQAL